MKLSNKPSKNHPWRQYQISKKRKKVRATFKGTANAELNRLLVDNAEDPKPLRELHEEFVNLGHGE